MVDYKFKSGDVVRSKSGGPDMIIEGIGKRGLTNDGEDTANCVWLDNAEARKEGLFRASTTKTRRTVTTAGNKRIWKGTAPRGV
jgi:uncharacterized protein YodC (DUF2158 family)